MSNKKQNAKPSSAKQKAADAAFSEYHEIVGIKDTMKALIACQRRITANKRGYRARARAQLGATAELALRATKSETAWRSFMRHEFWETCEGETPKVTDRSDGLRFVVRFAESAKSRQAAQNSSRHATIIKYLLEEERIRPADFLSYLSKAEQGMNDVYNKATAGKRQPVQDRRQNGGSKRDPKDTPEGPVRTVDLTRNIVLEVHKRHRLDELLSTVEGCIRYKRIGTEAGWVRFKATGANGLKESATRR